MTFYIILSLILGAMTGYGVACLMWMGKSDSEGWINVDDHLPKDGVLVLMKGHGTDFIVCKEGETPEEAFDRTSKIQWTEIGFYSEEDGGWCTAEGYPQIVRPDKWKAIDWN